MKKMISLTLMLMMLFSVCTLSVFAAETGASQNATVYVTIADGEGKLVLTQEAITVTDRNADGILTVDEALYAAHEAKYEGGADSGYASAVSEWGLSLTKLWGVENGGSYGYYVNNTSAMGLGEAIKDGDFINAFIYTDFTTWDTYCFFDKATVSGKKGDSIALTLSAAVYDEAYNAITVPVAGAVITIDGVATSYKTDADGKVTITLDKSGKLVISATSETETLVPPVCMASVESSAMPIVWIVLIIVAVLGIAGILVGTMRKKNK